MPGRHAQVNYTEDVGRSGLHVVSASAPSTRRATTSALTCSAGFVADLVGTGPRTSAAPPTSAGCCALSARLGFAPSQAETVTRGLRSVLRRRPLAALPNRPVRPNCALDFDGSSDGAIAIA
jgi:hypothetical protein